MSAREEYDGAGVDLKAAGVAWGVLKFLVALGPVGGALRAAGPRGGDLARCGDLSGV